MLSAAKADREPFPSPDKILLYCWVSELFSVLIPRKVGDGYLRVPYGHHYDPGLDAIAVAAGCDIMGLDGALDFQCGGSIFHGGDELRRLFATKVVPKLIGHYGMPAQEISAREYWERHPGPRV